MPEEDRIRLYEELEENRIASEPGIPFGPQTREEAIARLKESFDDLDNGNVGLLDDLMKELKNEYPWLCK